MKFIEKFKFLKFKSINENYIFKFMKMIEIHENGQKMTLQCNGLDHVKTHLGAACWLLEQSLRLHMALNKKNRHICNLSLKSNRFVTNLQL